MQILADRPLINQRNATGGGGVLHFAPVYIPELFSVVLRVNNMHKTKLTIQTKQKKSKIRMHSEIQLGTHLELRPVHRHVDAVVVRPPFQVFLVVGVVDCVVQFFVDL